MSDQSKRPVNFPASHGENASDRIAELFAAARQQHEAGHLAEAERLYREISTLDPAQAEGWHLLGIVAYQRGRNSEAIELIGRSLALNPKHAVAHYNLANMLAGEGRLDDSAAHFGQALALRPDYLPAHHNLANVLRRLGRADEAAAHYRQAIVLRPDQAAAYHDLGAMLLEHGKATEAAEHLQRAVALNPQDVTAHINLGHALKECGQLDDAVETYRQAAAVKPDFAEAHLELGTALAEQGKYQEAVAALNRALALQPENARVKVGLCMAQLPVIYLDEAEIDQRREAYERRLRALADEVERGVDLAAGLGFTQPFYLAYQGRNDRELQRLHGEMMCRALAAYYPPASLPRPPDPDEPVRVGIVSGFFRAHSNWKIPIKGWLSQLDREKFQILGYHTARTVDAETKAAETLCHRFVQGPLSIDRWRSIIVADAPHVLIYPEIGMDQVAALLAAMRLAPVQCNSWGHPETSGFPTLDYFLSSDRMEPPGGEGHYTEKLVRLPELSVYYEPLEPQLAPVTRAELGLRPGATVYWCGQALHKYLPQYDEVFPRIARDAGDCQFVFIEFAKSKHVTGLFRQRLDKAFAGHGLNAGDHCVVLPAMNSSAFAACIGQCDIVLDSIGWSGCNSILEGLVHNLPIVAMEGGLMRGRHTAAMLEIMGVTETVTETLDDYVAAATRFARDAAWRKEIASKISANKHRLYRDRTCITALEQFLDRVAREEREGSPAAWPSHPKLPM